MPQHQYINQNLSLPFDSHNTTIIGPSQANNPEPVFNFEIPGFKIKIIVTLTSFPFANLNQFQHTYTNTFTNNTETQFQQQLLMARNYVIQISGFLTP